MTRKYDELAEGFTEHEYGDPGRYFGHRAELLVSLGPPLAPGDRVLDLACADASAAPALLARGLAYTGVDASEEMVRVARGRVGGAARIELGDLLSYEPVEPVAATTIFRSLHLVADRVAFFNRLGHFTEKKVVFDVSPRKRALEAVRAELSEAGFPELGVHPFLVPQHGRLPGPVHALLRLAERVPPAAGLILRYRFSLLCAAYRPGTGAKPKPTTPPTTRESETP